MVKIVIRCSINNKSWRFLVKKNTKVNILIDFILLVINIFIWFGLIDWLGVVSGTISDLPVLLGLMAAVAFLAHLPTTFSRRKHSRYPYHVLSADKAPDSWPLR